MAQPRVFVSSTYFNLRHVREAVENFIREYGFQPVLFEKGHIAYSPTSPLQESCYDEIEDCDILVSLLGNRYGSDSIKNGYSISQMELLQALKLEKPVYIFVENRILAEYETYKLNTANKAVVFGQVDDPRIYEFLTELYNLPYNNPIFGFDNAHDITTMLRSQWSGLFCKLLRMSTKTDSPSNHPYISSSAPAVMDSFQSAACMKLQSLLQISFPIAFRTKEELTSLLHAFGFSAAEELPWETHYEWIKYIGGVQYVMRAAKSLFDEHGRHVPTSTDHWQDDLMTLEPWEVERKHTDS